MADYVMMERGQFVLMYVGGYMPRGGLSNALSQLVYGGSGWDILQKPSQQFEIVKVGHVMPKTFRDIDGCNHGRELVVASNDTEAGLVALREKLFAIGVDADRKVADEIKRVIAPFEDKVRCEALQKVHEALPHIFGRASKSTSQT